MELQEHLNENPRLREWYEAFSTEADNLAKQGYHLVTGWPADEYNLGWNDYIIWCHDQLDEVEEGADVQPFPTYAAWRDERMPDGDEGYTWSVPCATSPMTTSRTQCAATACSTSPMAISRRTCDGHELREPVAGIHGS